MKTNPLLLPPARRTAAHTFRAALLAVALLLAGLWSASAQIPFLANLDGDQEVPPALTGAFGVGQLTLNTGATSITANVFFSGLQGNATAAHIHGPAPFGVNAPVLFTFAGVPAASIGFITNQTFNVTPAQVAELKAGQWYFNVHTAPFPGGEIRGQILCSSNITVFSTNDAGVGSLRKALADICPDGSIVFALALAGKTITLTNGELVIDRNVSVVGLGPTNLTVNGNNASRVFRIANSNLNVNLSGLSISNGNAGTGFGGGLLNESTGAVRVAFCSISGCTAAGGGGLAHTNSGRLVLSASTVFNNKASLAGGGVVNADSGTLTLNNSTLSSNVAMGLLGLGAGGGLFNNGTVVLNNTTLSGNAVLAGVGGGIHNSSAGSVSLLNTLVASNSSSPMFPDLSGVFASLGHNLIGQTNGATGFVPSDRLNLNPLLGPLTNNGGQTLTHALLSGSPAINTGDNSVTNPPLSLVTDQRGLPRVEEVDIGAFELQRGVPFFVNCPTNLLVLTNDPGKCSATFIPNLIAIGPPRPGISCNPTSGAALMLGTNMITCTATNIAGTNFCTFKVLVLDGEPPTLICTNVVVNHTSLDGAIVNYAPPVVLDNCTNVIGTNCAPGPGLFPIGATDISCTATDAVGNVGFCEFRVLVLGARVLKTNVLAELRALLAASNNERDQERLEDAIENLSRALGGGHFIDDDHLRRGDGSEVFGREKEAVSKLLDLIEDNDRSSIPIATLQSLIDRLVRADRLLAALAIHEAMVLGLSPAVIAGAERELAEGDEELAAGDFEDAISEYRHAWEEAARPRITGTASMTGGMWRMDCMGAPGTTCSLQATSDLVNWVTLTTRLIGPDGRLIFEDASASTQRARFYRVVPSY